MANVLDSADLDNSLPDRYVQTGKSAGSQEAGWCVHNVERELKRSKIPRPL